MIVPVVMAGGVGSRLWPVSRELFPKQFISFRQGSPSLFQETLNRLQGLEALTPPIVVCNQEHRFLVAQQLLESGISGATIMLEPVGRNTAPAVALAALAALQKEPDPLLLVLAADHEVANVPAFRQAVETAVIHAASGKLVTFGIVPTRAETGYGYIRRGDASGSAYVLDRFVEKPDMETAEAYVESGEYYWNSGMFVFSAQRYLEELQASNPQILEVCRKALAGAEGDLDFTRIPEEVFSACPSDSIDYAVMEHTQEGVVVPLDAGWNDLGAWSALWEQGEQDDSGNVSSGDVILQDVHNSYIKADSRLVAMVGINDAVVIETCDALLVAAKDKVQNVKDIVSRLREAGRSETQSHNLVHRPWGSYERLVSDPVFQVKRITVKPGAALSLQMHYYRAEHWTVVRGTAKVTCGEKDFLLDENESTYIPIATKHRLENPGDRPIVLIEVQCGTYLGEDDIVRFEDNYGRQDQEG